MSLQDCLAQKETLTIIALLFAFARHNPSAKHSEPHYDSARMGSQGRPGRQSNTLEIHNKNSPWDYKLAMGSSINVDLLYICRRTSCCRYSVLICPGTEHNWQVHARFTCVCFLTTPSFFHAHRVISHHAMLPWAQGPQRLPRRDPARLKA